MDKIVRHDNGKCEKNLNRTFSSQLISGTCNVCSAPCSSCMHHNQAMSVIESNMESGSSEESSFANSVVQHPCKEKLHHGRQHTASEVSNLLSTSSSHDSYSENAESKGNSKIFDVKLEDIDVPSKVSSLVEEAHGEVSGKMLGQHGTIELLKSQSQTDVSTREFDSSLVAPLVVDNIEENTSSGGANNLDAAIVNCKAGSTSKSSLKNEKHDTDEETGKTSGEMQSGNFNPKSENVSESWKESETSAYSDIDEPVLEDDVKVCDICGDVGREEMLAICTRCSDGAEHTYCMRIMLDKLPEGDWLCEECKSKDEAQSKITIKPDDHNESSNVPQPSTTNKGFQQSHTTEKKLPASISMSLEIKANKNEVDESEAHMAKNVENVKPTLVCDAHFKKSSSTMKPGSIIPRSRNPAAPILKHAVGSNSSKYPTKQFSPRGVVLISPVKNLKPKVKTTIEALKPKTQMVPTGVDANKERVQTVVRSSSFRNPGTTSLNSAESSDKALSVNRVETPTVLGKPKGALERKNSITLDKSRSCLPPFAPVAASSIKLSETRCEKPPIVKGLEDGSAVINETRKQHPPTAKAASVVPITSHTSFKDPKVGHSIPKEDKSLISVSGDKTSNIVSQLGSFTSEPCFTHAENNKDINNPRPPSLTSGRSVRCQRCNEMGHLTQFCSVDKSRSSALKPSGERLVPVGNKSEKWRDTVKAAMIKTRMQRNSGFPGQSNDILLPNSFLSRDNSSKDLPNVPCRNSSLLEEGKPLASSDIRQHVLLPGENTPISEENGSTSVLDGSESRPAAESILPKEAFLLPISLSTSLSASAIPELEYVWQGCFQVRRNGRFCDNHTGIQAHLSTFASPKVVDVATKFPSLIELEEVPCLSAWPPQFRRKCPTEENIALFFFATDAESYEKSYKRILDNMLMNDLAFMGNLDGVELLIFPSNKLPDNAQRWNGLLFLWGVFRANKSEDTIYSVRVRKDVPGDSSNMQKFPHDFTHLHGLQPSNVSMSSACNQTEGEISFPDKALKSECGSHDSDGCASNSNSLHPSGLLSPQQQIDVNDIVLQAIDQSYSEMKNDCIYKKDASTKLCRVEDAARKPASSTTKEADIQNASFLVDKGVSTEQLKKYSNSDELCKREPSLSQTNIKKGTTVGKGGIRINVESDTLSVSSQDINESSGCQMAKRKHSCSSSPEPVAQISTSCRKLPWEKQGQFSGGDTSETKRIRPFIEEHCFSNINEDYDHRFSSKVYPLQANFLDDARERSSIGNEILPECSTSSEMDLFPVGSNSSCKPRPSSFISFPDVSPTTTEAIEVETPNLDLVLGTKKLPIEGTLPLFLPFSGRSGDEIKPPDPTSGGEDDISATLSLSLSIPSPGKNRACADGSLFFLGRSTDN